jgi:hypothetical protein
MLEMCNLVIFANVKMLTLLKNISIYIIVARNRQVRPTCS